MCRAFDDKFVIMCLVSINSFLAFSLSVIRLKISGRTEPLILGIVSPYDRIMEMNENETFTPRH